ncbi:SDR family oxidoreductase [Tepidibacillus decaturensis]|uniref:3-oxoacyl-ACP reductase n=1 Tax=Tepidibacillus decaturensis TaxID=1413211 RepID=A0A135L1R1_9BACI|nr:SDR family NAD(P)-dependent oxidoreductase [Tepidibacillus decaturensis]KXG42938.1 3-oxoacyl-ACP reductase [Tepidibacillus decaturensis]
MKSAIVTGASTGIGLAITKKLNQMNVLVYGLARDFSKTDYQHEHFQKIVCDITNTKQLVEVTKQIKDEENEVYILVNNAGIGYFGPHETLSPKQIETMIATNLKAPLILSNLLLRELRQTKGYMINISSITAKKSSTFGCAYAATKAGLTHFGISLFDEIRKSGVKVVTIHPDMTQTSFYDHLDFQEGDVPESYLTPECVANAVETILSQREGTVLTELTIQPQRHMINRKKQMKK